MAESYVRKMNVGFALVEEPAGTEGTLATETATDACLLRVEGFAPPNLDRELLSEGYITASLSKTAPVVGMFGDLGFPLPVFARGKGTLTYPDYHVAMKSVMGVEDINTNNAIVVSPAPTTSIFSLTANDLAEGQLILVNVTGVGYCLTRIVDITTQVITVWPPLPAIPATADVVYSGINWMLSSTTWPSFSSYFHFDGPKQAQLGGCHATTLKMNFQVGQRATLDFTVKAGNATENVAARGVTPTTDTTTKPPVCLGMTLDSTYAGTVTTSTATQTVLTTPQFGVAAGDYMLRDVGTLGSPVTCTFANGAETVLKSTHGLSNGNRVKFFTTVALPTGLSTAIIYYVVNKNADDFQVALTAGGAAVTFSDDGSGTNTYKVWTKGSGAWETALISTATGDPGTETTITHASMTNPADPGDTVYVQRKKCAGLGDTIEITVEMADEWINCMQATYGRLANTNMERTVTIEKSPYFTSWQEFTTRDNLVSSELRIILGSTLGNIFCVYMPNCINTKASLTGDNLMKVKATAQAVTDSRFLGNDDEIVIAVF